MNSLTSSGLGLRLCFPNAPAKARQGDRRKTTARSSTGFFGSCTPVLRGVTSQRYGPWQTIFTRFNRWRQDGTWVRIVTSLLDELDDKGQIDHDLWCIDGSVIRASRAAAGGGKKGQPFETERIGLATAGWA